MAAVNIMRKKEKKKILLVLRYNGIIETPREDKKKKKYVFQIRREVNDSVSVASVFTRPCYRHGDEAHARFL